MQDSPSSSLVGAHTGSGGAESLRPLQGTSDEETPPPFPPWLLRQKITIPEPVLGFVHRPELVRQTMPTQRRLTILKASAGFGKTTLLAQCCRRLQEEGVATAWISLDEQDEPAQLETYIAVACQLAGISLRDLSYAEGASLGPALRLGALVGEIQSFSAPFVIAFDELERVKNPASMSLLELLLQHGPPNLHVAVACRQLPEGLNVGSAVMEGRAEVVQTEDLRFSRADLAKFFDLRLSRQELAREMDQTLGWPLAMRISRNRMERGAQERIGGEQDFVRNWIESRLIADLDQYEREFLLDVALFDWIDAPLADEVLQRGDSQHLLSSMGMLDGLLEPSGSDENRIWRLHPLVREYCIGQRFRESRERFRAIHQRIAKALARRGETVSAMRHATEGNDHSLAGEILERAGGVRLWTREGVVRMLAANALLSDDVIEHRPRLALMRCVALGLTGRTAECRNLYLDVSSARRRRNEREQDGDFEYAVDDCIVRGGMVLYGVDLVASDWMQSLDSDMGRLMGSRRLDPSTRGHLEYARCVLHFLKGEFAEATKLLESARELSAKSQYIEVYGNLLKGQIEFVQGRVANADSHFQKARRIAKSRFVFDPVPMGGFDVASKELSLELNKLSSRAEPHGVATTLMNRGVPFSFFATAASLLIELKLRDGHIDQALGVADKLWTHVRSEGLQTFVRFLAALRVSLLVTAGRIDDAEFAWRQDNLPVSRNGCLDLDTQTWREMEAISCARLRLLIARGQIERARDLARELRAIAATRGLRRTQMRGLVLSVVLEQCACKLKSAVSHLEEFLGLFAASPYAWPLVQERTVCTDVVRAFLESKQDSPLRDSAESLLAAMHPLDEQDTPKLTERERQVLLRLEGSRDKQIADALGISVHGVRYHLRKLFNKLNVARRAEAVTRATELGLIPNDT